MIFLVLLATVVAQLAPVQHAALMTLYQGLACNVTLCPRFNSPEPCQGDLLTCSGANVLRIFLNVHRDLTGSIATTIGLLSRLTHLELSSTRITGSLPTQIAALSQLTFLYVQDSLLSGRFLSLPAIEAFTED